LTRRQKQKKAKKKSKDDKDNKDVDGAAKERDEKVSVCYGARIAS
jgi:hypothetical protein